MKFGNGLSALVQVDTICFSSLPRWHVSGDAGTLVVNDWSVSGRIVRANTIEFRMEEGIVYTAAGPTRTMAPRPLESIEELPLPKLVSDWTEYYRNFVASTEGREELLVKPSEALRTLRVIDAAFESSSTGVCVRMSI
jgi:predicted dehydrogenase